MPIANHRDSACIFLDVANSDDILPKPNSSGNLEALDSKKQKMIDDRNKPVLPKGISMVQDVISQQSPDEPAARETHHSQHPQHQESNEARMQHSQQQQKQKQKQQQQQQSLRDDDVSIVDDEGWSHASSSHNRQNDHKHTDLLSGRFIKMTRRFSNPSQLPTDQANIHEEEEDSYNDNDASVHGDNSIHSMHSIKSDTIHNSSLGRKTENKQRASMIRRHSIQHINSKSSGFNNEDEDNMVESNTRESAHTTTAISDYEQTRIDCIRFAKRIEYLEEEIARSNFEAAASKSSLDVVKLQYSQLALEFDDLRKVCDVLQEENDKLKKDNKELKQQAAKTVKQERHTWFGGMTNNKHKEKLQPPLASTAPAVPIIPEDKPSDEDQDQIQGFNVGDDDVNEEFNFIQDDCSTITIESSKKHTTTSTSWFQHSQEEGDIDEDFNDICDNNDDEDEMHRPPSSASITDDQSKCTTTSSTSTCSSNATITGLMDIDNAERHRKWKKNTNGGEFTDLHLRDSSRHRHSLEKRHLDVTMSKLAKELARPPQPHRKLQTNDQSSTPKHATLQKSQATAEKKSWWGGPGGSNRSLPSNASNSSS